MTYSLWIYSTFYHSLALIFEIRVAELVCFFQKFRKQQVAIVCAESHVNSKHWDEEKHLDQAGRSELLMGQSATQHEGKFPSWQTF